MIEIITSVLITTMVVLLIARNHYKELRIENARLRLENFEIVENNIAICNHNKNLAEDLGLRKRIRPVKHL